MGMRSIGLPISLTTIGNSLRDSDDQAPLRAEILQYYSAFRDLVMPLYPIVPDPLALELWIEGVLQSTTSHYDPGKLAVILSSLALGAQFTEAEVVDRWEISQNFITRASHYLQEANCIFEPSVENVQSLLMIGIGLQNLGFSHGAWNLLGLTYRCAQSLGLQDCTCDDELGYRGAMLWSTVTWQDALMSLRYDRKPLTDGGEDEASGDTAVKFSPYYDVMTKICLASRKLLRKPLIWRHDHHNISARVSDLERLVTTAREHLSPQCKARTLQQKFQYHSLRVHSSLLIAEFCRPSFSVAVQDDVDDYEAIRKKGLHYLLVVVESFLELCTFSNVPLRLWSLKQASLSCALVVALLNTRKACSKTEHLLRRMIDMLRISDVSSSSPAASVGTLELYEIYRKSANLLESILNRKDQVSASEDTGDEVPVTGSENPVAPGNDNRTFDITIDEFLNWPTDLSLFDNTFSDSFFEANMLQMQTDKADLETLARKRASK